MEPRRLIVMLQCFLMIAAVAAGPTGSSAAVNLSSEVQRLVRRLGFTPTGPTRGGGGRTAASRAGHSGPAAAD